jgi:hypothetical protein
MSEHDDLMNDYRPAIGDTLTYPVSSTMPNVENWNRTSSGEVEPTDKILWANSGGDYKAYMKAFVADPRYGSFVKPFKQATMMVSPTAWNTGYNDSTSNALSILAVKQGEAIKITDAIGILNNSIKRLEALLYDVQKTLKVKNNLRKNGAYVELANREAKEELTTLDSDIEALKALDLGYSTQLSQLRNDGRVLNQELDALLTDYKTTANTLNINDNFEKEMRKVQRKAGTGGLLVGGLGGFMGAAAIVFVIAQMRRSPQRTRSTARGADGLFFRAP